MQRADLKNWNAIGDSYHAAKSADLSHDEQIDEMLSRDRQINPHWHGFMQALDTLGLAEMESRHKEVQRLLRENGVTYVVHGEQQGHRPWELDPIPLIISNTDWDTISAGLTQRAELLNLILTDLYGERRLIKDGLIPPEAVYAHAGFLRACVGLIPSGFPFLLNYAADLARGSDGRVWVLGDRTQAPSGAGYALENRTALARALPNLFGEIGVHRLSFFFRALQNRVLDLQYQLGQLESATRIAPHQKDNPHVVVLTPGPLNETYFEHAYIANYLGYTLAQGDDLTVWDGRVWLKSLGGLRPVDIILRRVDDIFCDPLELRQDSRLGVAGLLEVIRQGNVTVVNPPGSGVMENPSLMPFLPNIAKHLIGEDLRLPSVATWWCGEPKQRDYVLANLKQLVIKPTYRQPGGRPLFGSELSRAELDTLRAQINAEPHLYVGQEYIRFSTTPSLIDGKLKPRRATLRAFLFAEKNGYAVMPGGLTRCEGAKGELTVSIQGGGVSKDTWILAPEPEPHISLWQQRTGRIQTAGASEGLSSRAAENLFWVGRYAERAEGQARLLRIMMDKAKMGKMGLETSRLGQISPSTLFTETLGGEAREVSELTYLRSMLRSLTGLTSSHPGFANKGEQSLENELLSIMLDTENNGSLVSTLQALVSAAYAVRDRWSTDTWRVMNNIENLCATLEKSVPEDGDTGKQILTDLVLQEAELASLDQLMIFLSALSGLNAESMTQTVGWISLDMGRRIERALLLIVLCRSSLVAVQDEWVEDLLLESVLAAAESLITYRSRYRAALHFPTVLELLLLDEDNPRSLLYQLKRLQEQIRVLPREKLGYRLSEEEQLILEALTQLQLSNTLDLAERSEHTTQRNGLEKLMVRLAQILVDTSDVLTHTYFSHIQRPQQLTTTDNL
ncbi:circularly permuted type 2 ATP-grasp protein [Candidatus Poribacteria bacterium]|nr:circularly permuted type 2 ATP-grasp protein [Candidatus Poribacteria bacterium]MYB02147.1 circularly permuted type 2 ATP-grasp protein [Candidatus Poribacteria bacterium]